MYPEDVCTECLFLITWIQDKRKIPSMNVPSMSHQCSHKGRRTRGNRACFPPESLLASARCGAEGNNFSQNKERTLNWITLIRGIICFLHWCWFSASPYAWITIKLPARASRRMYRQLSNCLWSIAMVHFTEIDDLTINHLKIKSGSEQVLTCHILAALIWMLDRRSRLTGEKHAVVFGHFSCFQLVKAC